jgi:hypothetical protein
MRKRPGRRNGHTGVKYAPSAIGHSVVKKPFYRVLGAMATYRIPKFPASPESRRLAIQIDMYCETERQARMALVSNQIRCKSACLRNSSQLNRDPRSSPTPDLSPKPLRIPPSDLKRGQSYLCFCSPLVQGKVCPKVPVILRIQSGF